MIVTVESNPILKDSLPEIKKINPDFKVEGLINHTDTTFKTVKININNRAYSSLNKNEKKYATMAYVYNLFFQIKDELLKKSKKPTTLLKMLGRIEKTIIECLNKMEGNTWSEKMGDKIITTVKYYQNKINLHIDYPIATFTSLAIALIEDHFFNKNLNLKYKDELNKIIAAFDALHKYITRSQTGEALLPYYRKADQYATQWANC